VGGYTRDLIGFAKDWGMGNFQFIIARQNDGSGAPVEANLPGNLEQFMIAGLANFDINERIRAGVMGYYWLTDEEFDFAGGGTSDTDLLTLGAYAGFRFTPSIELKGLYYWQDQGDSWRPAGSSENNADAWRVIVDVKQDVLKFTSAWLEYGQLDNNFRRFNNVGYQSFGKMGGREISLLRYMPTNNTNTTTIYGAYLGQQWNDRWRTYARYFVADYDSGNDDVTNWTLGVAYRLNPAVEFELAYDNMDFGNNIALPAAQDDHMVRFRTFVTF
jgi:hypothetical protein